MSSSNVTFRWLAVIILAILLVSVVVAAVVCMCMNISATEYTDAVDYSRCLRSAGKNGSLWYFPDEIPDGAQDVKFVFRMPFLRGDEIFELSFSISAEKLEEYREHFGNTAARRRNIKNISEYLLRESSDPDHGENDIVLIDTEHGRITFRHEKW